MTACFSGVRLRLRSEGREGLLAGKAAARQGAAAVGAEPDHVFLVGAVRACQSNHVGAAAEAADHHPDIDICFSKVTLALSTHDSCGVTEKDFALAAEADRLAAGPAT
jgi:4a-hydroxytetrahydrobiopterin dehydratase